MSTDSFNRGPALLRDIWALAGISIVIVLLRFLAKIRVGKLALDDGLMVFALCSALTGSSILTLGIQCGFGRPVWDVDTNQVSTVIFYDYLSQTFGLAGGATGRVAFIVFIISLLGARKTHRIMLWTLLVMQIIVNAIFVLIIFLQCPGHASAIWSATDQGQCWSLDVQTYYGYFQGAFNSATDLFLVAYASYIFWNLNLKLRIKCALIGLLGLGIFAMIASIIKTVQIKILANVDNDPTVATVDLERWLYIETYLVIITTSIPCLRALVRINKKVGPSSAANTYRAGAHQNRSTAVHTGYPLQSKNHNQLLSGWGKLDGSRSEDDILRVENDLDARKGVDNSVSWDEYMEDLPGCRI